MPIRPLAPPPGAVCYPHEVAILPPTLMVQIRLAVLGLMLLAAAGALAANLQWAPFHQALAGAPASLTFNGTTADGGEISMTFTPDRVGIERVSIKRLRSSDPCHDDPLSRTVYFDPAAEPIGDFLVSIRSSPSMQSATVVSFTGSLSAANELTGAYEFGSLGCGGSDPVPFILTGPVDTGPGPNDHIFMADVGNAQGSITVALDPAMENVTAARLDSVALPPCTDPDNPLDISMILQPPFALSPPSQGALTNGQFSVGAEFNDAGSTFGISGRLIDDQNLAGTVQIRLFSFAGICEASAPWTTVNSATPLAPTATAITPQALPQSGLGRDHGASLWQWVVLAGALLVAGGAFSALLRRST